VEDKDGRAVHSFRIRVGDRLFLNSVVDGRGTLGNLVEVSELTRKNAVLTIVDSDEGRVGEKINLVR